MRKHKLDKLIFFCMILFCATGVFLICSGIMHPEFETYLEHVKPVNTHSVQNSLFVMINSLGYAGGSVLSGTICLVLASILSFSGSFHEDEISVITVVDKQEE